MQASPSSSLTSSRPARQERDLWRLGVLPVMALGAVVGQVGLYWDIAWHIDKGRDSFFTAPHNLVYANLLVVLLASLVALVRDRRDSPLHLRLGALRLHPAALVMAIGAAVVLFFAPADELWHRFFGLDVTLWGPMHLVGLTGFSLALFGGLVGAWLERDGANGPYRRLLGDVALFFAGTLLVWAVAFTAEYEFGVPQFPMFLQPALLAGLPAFVLVLAATLRPRAWSAAAAALVFTAIRLLIALWLGASARLDLAGETRPTVPLLLLSGLAVDLLVSRRAPGWLAGLAAGAVALLANLAVVNLGDRTPWTGAIVLEAALPALALSAALGFLGERVGRALEPRPAESPTELARQEAA